MTVVKNSTHDTTYVHYELHLTRWIIRDPLDFYISSSHALKSDFFLSYCNILIIVAEISMQIAWGIQWCYSDNYIY